MAANDDKPAFDPSQPFNAVAEEKPAFDPNQSYSITGTAPVKGFLETTAENFPGSAYNLAKGVAQTAVGAGLALANPNPKARVDFLIDMIEGTYQGIKERYSGGLGHAIETDPAGVLSDMLAVAGIAGGIKALPKSVPDAFKQFHEQVVKNSAGNLTINDGSVDPPQNTPVPTTAARSSLAQTGEPHVDAVINHPVLKNVIDNPVIDRTHEIPNSWGGSVPIDNPKTYVDKDFPRSMTVDGVTFDPADAAAVHENVEELVITQLRKAGMSRDAALSAAYWGWGNPAEHAWYKAHGMDPDHVEAALKPYLDQIAERKANPANIPPDLFKETYPDGNPLRDAAGEIDKPSAEELDRAKRIMADWQRGQEAMYGFHGTAAEVDFGANFDVMEGGNKSEHGVSFFGVRPETANVYTDTNHRARARVNDAIMKQVDFEKEMKQKYGTTEWRPKATMDERKEWMRLSDETQAARNPPEGAPGPRIIPVRIKPGKTETFDVAKLFGENDKEFLDAFRETYTNPDIGAAPPIYKTYTPEERNRRFEERLEALQGNYREHEKTRARILEETKDEEGGPHDIGPWEGSLDLIAPAVYLAKKRGLDTARITNLAEHGEQIIALNPKNIQPRYQVNPLQEAHELGVIGPPKETVPTDSPAVAAQRAIPANMRQGDKITMTPAGEPIDAWEARFNQYIAKVDSRDSFRDMFKRMAAENNNFPLARAGAVSGADVETVAHAAGLDPTAIDGVKLRTTFKTDDEIRVVTQTMKKLADDVLASAEKVRAEASPQNLAELQAAIIKQNYAQDTLQSATRYTNALRAEWGRSGNALQEIQTAAGDLKQINEFLKKYGKGTVDDLKEVANGLRGLDREGVAKNLTSMRGQNPHWTYWLYQQNLISGLVTHVGYGGTNALFTEVERVLAPAFAAMIDKVRGGEQHMFLGEAAMAQWGIIHAVPDAARAAWQAFKTNQRVPLKGELEVAERLNGKPPVPYPTMRPNWGRLGEWMGEGVTGKLETALGVPGRFANLEHTFFRALNTDASAKALAYRAAAKEGHPVLSQEFRDAYNRHLANPTDTERQTSIDNGYSGSFMEKLGDSSGAWARWARDNWFFRWIFPFQHIPGNIVRNVARYSPAQILGPEMRAELAGERGVEKQNLAMAKMVIGSSVMGYFAYKALMNEVTGDYPTDPKERQRWQLLNMQPNSVRSGDEWLSLDRYFGPFGILAKVGADLGNIYMHYNGQDDDAMMKAGWAAIHGAANVLGSEVGFISLKNIMDAINDPKAFAKYAGYQVGTMIPYSTFLSQDASAIDPYMRQAKGLVDNLKYRIPFLREQVMPKRDPLYGEPVTNPGYFGQAGATAGFIRRTSAAPDFVKQELDRIGYFPTAPKPEIGGVKLTREQFDKYEATAGPLVKAALSGLVRSPSWQAHTANPQWQKEVAKLVISAARAKARGAMQLDDPSLIEAGRQRRLTQINGAK